MKKKMSKPIPYYGGKYELVKHILPVMPEHESYIEVFAGGGSIFFAKEPSKMEVLNDRDSALMNFYQVLQDPTKFETFQILVELSPYSRRMYEHCKATYRHCPDDVQAAARYFVAAVQSYSAIPGAGWGREIKRSAQGMSAAVSRYLSRIERLPEIRERLIGVQIEDLDFRDIIKAYDHPGAFFYLDPPYIKGTRRVPNVYKHEMTDEDHEEMVELLLGLKGKAILSGYAHPIYGPLECACWRRYDYEVNCRSAANVLSKYSSDKETMREKMKRIETLWVKP